MWIDFRKKCDIVFISDEGRCFDILFHPLIEHHDKMFVDASLKVLKI